MGVFHKGEEVENEWEKGERKKKGEQERKDKEGI